MRLRISGMNIGGARQLGLERLRGYRSRLARGRVEREGHSSVGGGRWFSWLTNRAAASIGVSHSSEDNLAYFVLGGHF